MTSDNFLWFYFREIVLIPISDPQNFSHADYAQLFTQIRSSCPHRPSGDGRASDFDLRISRNSVHRRHGLPESGGNLNPNSIHYLASPLIENIETMTISNRWQLWKSNTTRSPKLSSIRKKDRAATAASTAIHPTAASIHTQWSTINIPNVSVFLLKIKQGKEHGDNYRYIYIAQ